MIPNRPVFFYFGAVRKNNVGFGGNYQSSFTLGRYWSNPTWIGDAACCSKICQQSLTELLGLTFHTWWFPEIGVPPNHQFIDGFSMINQPFWIRDHGLQTNLIRKCLSFGKIFQAPTNLLENNKKTHMINVFIHVESGDFISVCRFELRGMKQHHLFWLW